MVLLDTDVMIDILRKHQPALAWLDSLEKEAIGIPGLVALELLQGCRGKNE
jgi:predicted nucleic acid-binding protein